MLPIGLQWRRAANHLEISSKHWKRFLPSGHFLQERTSPSAMLQLGPTCTTRMHSSVSSFKVSQRFSNICKDSWIAHSFRKHVAHHRCADQQLLLQFLQILNTARTIVFLFHAYQKHSANEIWSSPNDLAHFPWRAIFLCTASLISGLEQLLWSLKYPSSQAME